MSEFYYTETAQWEDFLAELKTAFRVYLPQAKDDDYLYQEYKDSKSPFSFNSYRPTQPIKSFLFYPKEKVAEGFSARAAATEEVTPTVVVGLKNCDLHSLRVQDFVFKEGIEVDPLYNLRRENTILISGDCTGFKEVCFCLALEVLPHPEQGFDLNLSPLTDGFMVEVAVSETLAYALGDERGLYILDVSQVADITPPRVAAHLPARDETGVSYETTIRIPFSENMDHASAGLSTTSNTE